MSIPVVIGAVVGGLVGEVGLALLLGRVIRAGRAIHIHPTHPDELASPREWPPQPGARRIR